MEKNSYSDGIHATDMNPGKDLERAKSLSESVNSKKNLEATLSSTKKGKENLGEELTRTYKKSMNQNRRCSLQESAEKSASIRRALSSLDSSSTDSKLERSRISSDRKRNDKHDDFNSRANGFDSFLDQLNSIGNDPDDKLLEAGYDNDMILDGLLKEFDNTPIKNHAENSQYVVNSRDHIEKRSRRETTSMSALKELGLDDFDADDRNPKNTSDTIKKGSESKGKDIEDLSPPAVEFSKDEEKDKNVDDNERFSELSHSDKNYGNSIQNRRDTADTDALRELLFDEQNGENLRAAQEGETAEYSTLKILEGDTNNLLEDFKSQSAKKRARGKKGQVPKSEKSRRETLALISLPVSKDIGSDELPSFLQSDESSPISMVGSKIQIETYDRMEDCTSDEFQIVKKNSESKKSEETSMERSSSLIPNHSSIERNTSRNQVSSFPGLDDIDVSPVKGNISDVSLNYCPSTPEKPNRSDITLSNGSTIEKSLSGLKSCLSNKKRKYDGSLINSNPYSTIKRQVAFGPSSAAEFNNCSPSNRLTPLPSKQACELFSVEKINDSSHNSEKYDANTKINSDILEQWESMIDGNDNFDVSRRSRPRNRRASILSSDTNSTRYSENVSADPENKTGTEGNFDLKRNLPSERGVENVSTDVKDDHRSDGKRKFTIAPQYFTMEPIFNSSSDSPVENMEQIDLKRKYSQASTEGPEFFDAEKSSMKISKHTNDISFHLSLDSSSEESSTDALQMEVFNDDNENRTDSSDSNLHGEMSMESILSEVKYASPANLELSELKISQSIAMEEANSNQSLVLLREYNSDQASASSPEMRSPNNDIVATAKLKRPSEDQEMISLLMKSLNSSVDGKALRLSLLSEGKGGRPSNRNSRSGRFSAEWIAAMSKPINEELDSGKDLTETLPTCLAVDNPPTKFTGTSSPSHLVTSRIEELVKISQVGALGQSPSMLKMDIERNFNGVRAPILGGLEIMNTVSVVLSQAAHEICNRMNPDSASQLFDLIQSNPSHCRMLEEIEKLTAEVPNNIQTHSQMKDKLLDASKWAKEKVEKEWGDIESNIMHSLISRLKELNSEVLSDIKLMKKIASSRKNAEHRKNGTDIKSLREKLSQCQNEKSKLVELNDKLERARALQEQFATIKRTTGELERITVLKIQKLKLLMNASVWSLSNPPKFTSDHIYVNFETPKPVFMVHQINFFMDGAEGKVLRSNIKSRKPKVNCVYSFDDSSPLRLKDLYKDLLSSSAILFAKNGTIYKIIAAVNLVEEIPVALQRAEYSIASALSLVNSIEVLLKKYNVSYSKKNDKGYLTVHQEGQHYVEQLTIYLEVSLRNAFVLRCIEVSKKKNHCLMTGEMKEMLQEYGLQTSPFDENCAGMNPVLIPKVVEAIYAAVQMLK